MSTPLRRSLKLGSILQRPILSLRTRPSTICSSLSLSSSSSSSRIPSSRPFSTSPSNPATTSSSPDTTSTSVDERSAISPTSDPPKHNPSFLPSQSQIFVVPFHKTREKALERLETGVRAQAALFSRSILRGIGFALSAAYPKVFPSFTVNLVNIAPIYLPVWSVRCNIEAETSEGEDLALISKMAFFPGTSVTPLSQLQLQPTLHTLPLTLSKFNPEEDLEQHDMEITPVPFDTSPLVLPSVLSSSSSLDLGDLGSIEDTSAVRWNKLDAVPIYLPFYVARFTIGAKNEQDFSLMYDASSPEPGDCVMHFPSVKPLYTQERVRPLTVMGFKGNGVERPTSRLRTPAFEFDLYPEPSADEKKKVGGRVMSRTCQLSSDLEDWLETEGTREELRRLSLAGPKEGGEEEVGRIVEW